MHGAAGAGDPTPPVPGTAADRSAERSPWPRGSAPWAPVPPGEGGAECPAIARPAPAGPTVVSLCCGAGGLDLGFVAAGFRVVYAADFNAHAVATYRENLGRHVERADLTLLTPDRIPDADLWVAGPPCQPFSIAGLRNGTADPRDMWPHALRLLEAKRPPFAVFENVPGMLTWNNGTYLRAIEGRLHATGYAITRSVLDAADFGVPQHRHRVFLICRHGGPQVVAPWPTHGDPAWLTARSLFDGAPRRPWVTVREALGIGGGLARSVAPGEAAAGRPASAGAEAPRVAESGSALDAPALTVTDVEGKGASPADVRRRRKASALLAGATADDTARIQAQRNATRVGHGDGASVDAPSVTVATNPPRWRAAQIAQPLGVASKRQRSVGQIDAPSVTVAADGRESLVALRLAGVPAEAAVDPGRGSPSGEAAGSRPTATPGPSNLLDAPHGTLRAGTHGVGGWSPKHQAGYIIDPDGPAPTLFMGGHATERTPGGGGAHQWTVRRDDWHGGSGDADAPIGTIRAAGMGGWRIGASLLPGEAAPAPWPSEGERAALEAAGASGATPSQTIDSSGELHRPGGHQPGEPSRGARSRTYLRRLTTEECARLQAFPDWFRFSGSSTARYAQIGNAVPPLLAWHIANAVRAAMDLPAVPVPDVLAWYGLPRDVWRPAWPAAPAAPAAGSR